MNIQNQELIDRLAKAEHTFQLKPAIVATGQFIPIDWSRGILLDPKTVRLMAREFKRIIDFNTIDVIAGIDLQGVPLAMAIALETDIPCVIAREKPKRPGRPSIIGDVNFLFEGARALLVDDLMAFGGTKEDRARRLEEHGARATDCAVFVQVYPVAPTEPLTPDYNFDAQSFLRERNIKLHTLIDYEELAQLQLDAGTITPELFAVIKENVNAPYWENGERMTQLIAYMKKENVLVQEHVIEFARRWGMNVLS